MKKKKPPRVYCDNGVLPNWLSCFSRKNKIILIYFPYENRNHKIPHDRAIPSIINYDDPGITYDMPNIKYDSQPSSKYAKIEKILGKKNKQDIKHLDSAFKSRANYFITSEIKGALYEKKEEIENLLGIKIYNQLEKEKFKKALKLEKKLLKM